MDSSIPSWSELYEQNDKLESMIHIYQEEIETLEEENADLKSQIEFLQFQLEVKTMGLPDDFIWEVKDQ